MIDWNLSRHPFLGQVSFHLRPIGLQTLVVIDSESYQMSFPSICVLPCEVAVLLDLNLSRCPFLRQVIHLDLLLCTRFNSEYVVLFPCHIFTQRPMNGLKIKQSYVCCFGLQQLLANSTKKFISHDKKCDLSPSDICKAKKLFDSWNETVSQEWQHVFFTLAFCCQQRLLQTRKHPVFDLTRPYASGRATSTCSGNRVLV